MGYVILAVVLVALAGMDVVISIRLRQTKKDLEFLQEESDRDKDLFDRKELVYQAELFSMSEQLENAYTSLNLALGASPGVFDHVEVELGINGVIYQFRSLEKAVTP
jgi:hypothetical protein